jgi:hypothetical protein
VDVSFVMHGYSFERPPLCWVYSSKGTYAVLGVGLPCIQPLALI